MKKLILVPVATISLVLTLLVNAALATDPTGLATGEETTAVSPVSGQKNPL